MGSTSIQNRTSLVCGYTLGQRHCLFLIVAAAVLGCASPDAIEMARQRGAEAGREEGLRAGKSAGYASASSAAREESFDKTLDDLYGSGEFRRDPLYIVAVLGSFFAVGACIQWTMFYMARSVGVLKDIDHLLLPEKLTRIDLTNVSVQGEIPTQISSSSSVGLLIVAIGLATVAGCQNPEEVAWKEGYNANYSAAYQEGFEEGARRGREAGEREGTTSASEAVKSARAWRLYSDFAIWGAIFGIALGSAAQYLCLACCDRHYFSEMLAVALVPAMRSSEAYAILRRQRDLLIWCEEEIAKVTATTWLHATRIQAVHDLCVKKIKAISSIEQFTHSQLLEVAKRELMEIVEQAEREAMAAGYEQPRRPTVEPPLPTFTCPYCNKRLRLQSRTTATIAVCPYDGCGKRFQLPPMITPT